MLSTHAFRDRLLWVWKNSIEWKRYWWPRTECNSEREAEDKWLLPLPSLLPLLRSEIIGFFFVIIICFFFVIIRSTSSFSFQLLFLFWSTHFVPFIFPIQSPNLIITLRPISHGNKWERQERREIEDERVWESERAEQVHAIYSSTSQLTSRFVCHSWPLDSWLNGEMSWIESPLGKSFHCEWESVGRKRGRECQSGGTSFFLLQSPLHEECLQFMGLSSLGGIPLILPLFPMTLLFPLVMSSIYLVRLFFLRPLGVYNDVYQHSPSLSRYSIHNYCNSVRSAMSAIVRATFLWSTPWVWCPPNSPKRSFGKSQSALVVPILLRMGYVEIWSVIFTHLSRKWFGPTGVLRFHHSNVVLNREICIA